MLLAAKKEMHYFNNAYGRGEAWYLSHFPLSVADAVARRRLGVRPVVGGGDPGVYLPSTRASTAHGRSSGESSTGHGLGGKTSAQHPLEAGARAADLVVVRSAQREGVVRPNER